jgi:hypothetical protein
MMTENQAIVRLAQSEDIEQLTDLMYEYIVDFYKRPKPLEAKLRDLILMLLNGSEGVQFVAEQDGRLVGFATLYFTYSTLRAQAFYEKMGGNRGEWITYSI